MDNPLGNFANINVEAFLRDSERRVADFAAAQKEVAAAVGQATVADGHITVQCTARGGVTRLDIDPRAKRMSVQEMSEEILAAIHAADADLQRQLSTIMTGSFGGLDPALGDPDPALAKMTEAQHAFDRMMGDAMGELDRMRKKLGY
ncbi:YbaB/EbfC family nucleoid-associated protein [Nonomuraea aurantiaca]|uniref:YbaB/EbfC family nucleoid-associated protein n=1 Tax=Nonomuraea aurantiaca TaxID=2878562 RepID=UPI001CD9B1EE|nr:YbaB/EbfC family nucleoid-associated protein [Nonomuraea aurantiaca]MCA2227578.1 YbaB/EbfC family nucleoid-associated protein [Nonomuraea aurantiaca]